MSKIIRWNEEKNQLLQLQRNISFEHVLEKIEKDEIIDRYAHPNSEKYPHQQIFVISMDNYIWYVPFIETEEEIFLKSIIPSRKLMANYGGKKNGT
ncbi:MAG: toxin [Sulfuricurvum sp.]